MGVDAGIFSETNKKFYWFDREKNIRGYENVDGFWDRYPVECGIASDIYHKMSDTKFCVTKDEAIYVAELSRRAWLESPNEYGRSRALWCENIIKFINLNNLSLFSLKSDHGPYWPECYDSYTRIKDEELN
jgi:hypothetical protein